MTDWFYDLLPMAITYGMSIKEFWEDDPNLFWAYRFSFYERQKANQETQNVSNWLQGAYIYEALVVALGNSFGGKGMKPLSYPSKPYELGEQKKEKEEKKKKQILEQQVIDLKARIAQVNGIRKSNNADEKGKKVGEKDGRTINRVADKGKCKRERASTKQTNKSTKKTK